MSKIYFVLPAYNEAANIAETIRQWHAVVVKTGTESRLVIANDGSRDETYQIMKAMEAECPQLVALDKPNSGHGATVLYLYRYALEHGAEYVFQTDSDGQTLPEEYWPMHTARRDYDFQIGFRHKRGDGLARIVVTRVLRLVVWLTMGEWVTDANTPFRLMEAGKLRAVLNVMPRDFFLANVAVSAIAKRWRYSILFRPITFRPRQGGVNSINLRRITRIGIKAVAELRTLGKAVSQKPTVDKS